MRCGTSEQWKIHENDRIYHGMVRIPGAIYTNGSGICLVTSQNWVDYLTERTDKMPEEPDWYDM